MKDYKIDEALAKGYSGHVYKGTNLKNNEKICIKVVSCDDPTEIKFTKKQVCSRFLSPSS
jgi:hypothetical protein